eukprot:CAMPEP_0195001506 /NCGR_PEP_ID=MMETSP0326_2-20130528/1470_1 /TAXON_ID=2866 ORGANISM="Crypthecodinium cohnii, Strain Seligo" /NCGR_SAMPLE_ID=MMETSP0326_2 /ASSEMBLY_ACC=CAM_ASM_000348 /LENGTH=88 /DNA_ID=CAMNT_0040004077 /DNA_START=21 /DNA_END=288 /DNA_ORIENTATION=+
MRTDRVWVKRSGTESRHARAAASRIDCAQSREPDLSQRPGIDMPGAYVGFGMEGKSTLHDRRRKSQEITKREKQHTPRTEEEEALLAT